MRDYVIQVFLFLCIFFRFVSLFANFQLVLVYLCFYVCTSISRLQVDYATIFKLQNTCALIFIYIAFSLYFCCICPFHSPSTSLVRTLSASIIHTHAVSLFKLEQHYFMTILCILCIFFSKMYVMVQLIRVQVFLFCHFLGHHQTKYRQRKTKSERTAAHSSDI